MDQQKLSFQIASLQIDNQLRSSPYPIMLSFDREYKNNLAGHVIREDDMKPSERILQRTSHLNFEPVFYLAVSKWRKKDVSLVSFEYISLRCALLHLEQFDRSKSKVLIFFCTMLAELQMSVLSLNKN